MHSQAASDPAGAHHDGQQVGSCLQELGELVDDDEQGRRGAREVCGRAPGVEVGVAGIAQQSLTAVELPAEGVREACGRVLRVEVGDVPRDLRQLLHPAEGGAALVVDEHDGELLWVPGGQQPSDERAQQFALARAGGADDEPVRAVAAVRGLIEIEHDGVAVVIEAEGDAQPRQGTLLLPRGAQERRHRRGGWCCTLGCAGPPAKALGHLGGECHGDRVGPRDAAVDDAGLAPAQPGRTAVVDRHDKVHVRGRVLPVPHKHDDQPTCGRDLLCETRDVLRPGRAASAVAIGEVSLIEHG